MYMQNAECVITNNRAHKRDKNNCQKCEQGMNRNQKGMAVHGKVFLTSTISM